MALHQVKTQKYADKLANPGGWGAGSHAWGQSCANLGVIAGKQPDEIFIDMRRVCDPRIPDAKIHESVAKAYRELGNGTYKPTPRPKPVIDDGKAALQSIIPRGKYGSEQELVEASPVPIPTDHREQQRLFLTMFEWSDFVFIGDRLQPGSTETIQPACHWIEAGAPGPFIIVNPLSGYPAPKKSGDGETYRGDGCIKAYRHCLVEFDSIPIEDQIRFWSAAKLPVRALIHTGNKSIHAWLDIYGMNITTPEMWQETVKNDLYGKRLIPLGVDPACSNAARLARLPGVFRQEKNQWQRLLWLSKDGQNVC